MSPGLISTVTTPTHAITPLTRDLPTPVPGSSCSCPGFSHGALSIALLSFLHLSPVPESFFSMLSNGVSSWRSDSLQLQKPWSSLTAACFRPLSLMPSRSPGSHSRSIFHGIKDHSSSAIVPALLLLLSSVREIHVCGRFDPSSAFLS